MQTKQHLEQYRRQLQENYHQYDNIIHTEQVMWKKTEIKQNIDEIDTLLNVLKKHGTMFVIRELENELSKLNTNLPSVNYKRKKLSDIIGILKTNISKSSFVQSLKKIRK